MEHMSRSYIFIAVMISLLVSVTYDLSAAVPMMDEICDNGIDDDNDGLIDLNDNDCVCNDKIFDYVDLIPNPGFALVDGCCVLELNIGISPCLENWVAISDTPDIYSPNCLSESEIVSIEALIEIEINSEVARCYYDGSVYEEILGTCFSSPLTLGKEYVLGFDIALTNGEDEVVNFALYGVKDCGQLTTIDGENICNEETVVELAVGIDYMDFPDSQWTQKDFSFVADYPYEAFFLGLSCSAPNSWTSNVNLFFDNYTLQESEDYFTLLSTEGNLCDLDLQLSSPLMGDYDYQWYFDGIAIIGATDDQYIPTEKGEYILIATWEGGLSCIESLPFIVDDYYENIVVHIEESICYGSSIIVYEMEYSVAGSYTIPVQSTTDCDTIYYLDLTTPLTNTSSSFLVEINEGEVYPFGGKLLSKEGVYYDTLSTDGECDSLVTLTLVFDQGEPNLSYDSHYFNEDCSLLFATVCNTGNAIFEEDELQVSLFNENPIDNTTNAFSLNVFDSGVDILMEPGECQVLIFWAADYSDSIGDFYGFINVDPSVSAPFDFENDFPNTSYPEVDYTDNVFEFNFDSCGDECTDPDLTIAQVEVDLFCTQLNVNICNVGESLFSENQLSFSIYNEDPSISSVGLNTVLNYDTPLTIILDECYDVYFDISSFNTDLGSFYIMVNDDGTANTPFNFDIDFPTTGYIECNYVNNLAVFNFDDCDEIPTVEICDNGIDDDNDGLIDAFDPDCPCNNLLDFDYSISTPFPCVDPIILSVPIVADFNYQWYVDGVPLAGETHGTYGASVNIYDQSNQFYVYIDDGINCKLLGPISIDPCLDYEICDNGIDDDNDGLIDAFDPDCDCTDTLIQGQTHIPNPGFEEHTGCCFSNLDFSENNCIDEWELVAPSPDYFGVDCISIEEGEGFVNTFDDSFVGLGMASTGSEMLGVCLSTPLQSGIEYKIDIKACVADNSLFPTSGPVEIALYGFSGPCPDFSSLIDPSNDDLCSLPLQKEELITITSADLLQREFRNIEATITPSMDIDYVIFSLLCGQSSIEFSYFMIANVQISEKVNSPWGFSGTISTSDLCEDPLELSIPYSDTLSYQWYQDSIPITGEDAAILELDLTTAVNSQYHVFVYNDNGCVLVGPVTIEHTIIPPTNLFASICQGATYSFANLELMSAGIYRDTLTSQNGCDSILILQLSILDFLEETITATICEDATYPFDNQELSTSGIYRDTLTSVMGCDSIVILDLTVVDQIEVSVSESICEGEEFDFNGRIVDAQGLYFDTLSTQMGCDSIIELVLGFSNYLRADMIVEICQGESFLFGDIDLTQEGIYMDTIPQVLTCDSIIELKLNVLDVMETTTVEIICEGEFFPFDGQMLSLSGVYQDTLTGVNGCDSIVAVDLTVISKDGHSITESICEGGQYDFNGQLLTAEGIYKDTLTNQMGCDSIVELVLGFSNYLRADLEVILCEGESYFFSNMNLNQEGLYIDTISNSTSCDSIISLFLEIDMASVFTFEDSICTGDSYSFAGQELFSEGTYFDNLQNYRGCDSIVTLILSEKVMPELLIEQTICDGEEFVINTQAYSETGDYTLMLEASEGCDTLLTLSLIVEEAFIIDTTYAEILEGDIYTFNDIVFNEAGIYDLSLMSVSGCDSLVVLNLSIAGGVYVPNVFSTSSISGNNRFIMVSNGDVVVTEYSIFDRWGNRVFSNKNFRTTDGLENYWDGYINNQVAMKGVYVYYIQYEKSTGELIDMVGSVTVL